VRLGVVEEAAELTEVPRPHDRLRDQLVHGGVGGASQAIEGTGQDTVRRQNAA
jgi:hypothetical protein